MLQTTSSLVESYLDHLRLQGRAEGTQKAFASSLKQFEKALSIQDYRDVTPADIERYWKSVNARLLPEAAYAYLRVVKMFFRFLNETNRLLVDPAQGFALPKLHRKLIGPVLSKDEMARLLESCTVPTPVGVRDRAILEFLYSTGLRVSEFRSIKVKDVDLVQQVAMVRAGKGMKDRLVPVGQTAKTWVERYLSEARPQFERFNPGVEELFISRWGKSLSLMIANMHLRKLGKRVNLPSNLTCHVIRRTLATDLLRNGASPAQVAGILGHEDLRSLSRYVKFVAREIKETHSATHPREVVHHE